MSVSCAAANTKLFTADELDTLETLCDAATEVHRDSFTVVRLQPQLLQMSLWSREFSCIPELHISLCNIEL